MADHGAGGTIDLLNVDYEDVLHLYRGWRHAESQLKEKNKELTSLKNRIKQLQDSHAKFRGQISALESVKELTVTLKTQLAILEEENKQLVIENSTLSEVNNQAEELLIEGETTTHKLSSQVNKHSLEAAEYKGRCSQLLESQAELEKLLIEEQTARLATETRLKSLEQTIEKLSIENHELKWKLETSHSKLSEYNREIESASGHLAHLTQEISDMNTLKERVSFLETEKIILKRDIIRLLRLFEHYPAAKGFLKQWQDSEGMSFMGTNNYSVDRGGGAGGGGGGGQYNLTYGGDNIHDRDLPEVTPQELAQFKRVHQVDHDVNVMFPTMEEELDHWSPHSSIVQGYQFLTSKLPVAPLEVLQTFLRKMNKIWLRREKRRIQRVKENYENKIADLKRQLSNSRPYHGVMAERKIRCLNNQVKAIRCRSLNCKPKPWNEYGSDDDDDGDGDMYLFEHNGPQESRGRKTSSDLIAAEKGWISPLSKSKRSTSQPPSTLICSKCQSHERIGRSLRSSFDDSHFASHSHSPHGATTHSKKSTKGNKKDSETVSSKDFFGATSHSVDQLQSQRNRRGVGSNPYESSSSAGPGGATGGGAPSRSTLEDNYGTPSAEYLRGAIWLGRNIHMITEDLVEQLDSFRSKYLREVSSLSRTHDSSQSPGRGVGQGGGGGGEGTATSTSHRLSLLAASGITDAMTIVYHARTKSRKMLQNASSLTPGDQNGLQKFLLDLPIESMLTKGTFHEI